MRQNPILVLWDIDGTLLTTGRAGRDALLEAARECLGDAPELEAVDLRGRLDSDIWREMTGMRRGGNPAPGEDRFRERYLASLKRRTDGTKAIRLHPGVRGLVERLAAEENAAQGVLSGNYPEIGEYKILRAGLPLETFPVRAWATDGIVRRDLVPAAMRRYREFSGRPIEAGRVIVVGDTPRDVDCARSNGCRSIAVATGDAPKGALEQTGADAVWGDLSDANAVMEWILRNRG